MDGIIHFFVFIPLVGFLISLFIPEKKEFFISAVAFTTSGLNFLVLVSLAFVWILQGHPPLSLDELVLYRAYGYLFTLNFYFDKISCVYLFVGSLLTLMVTVYSRYYLHREVGYKRFFNTILFFYIGYSITVLSGNFETLFVGWEILGISSFLLIAFYRNRYLPVKNGIKVFSIYRIGDVGMLLAMWLSHYLWHENIKFMQLNNYVEVNEHIQNHSLVGVFISLMLLVAAAAKSAQLPFSSWLPRAMEGPTPSSAIFYGSLSVHIGVFLLLRTYPFWEHQYSVRVIIGLLGLCTSVVTMLIARVQSSVKSQIAYASASQIGLIFIEVALGFENVALFHFAGNAFLRTYQLLVSPSLVSYLIREQFYEFTPRKHDEVPKWLGKIYNSVYLLSIKEFNLDRFLSRYLWDALKSIGQKVNYFDYKLVISVYGAVLLGGFYTLYHKQYIPGFLQNYMSLIIAVLGLILVLKSFVERKSPRMAWLYIIMNHCFILLAVSYNDHFDMEHAMVYLSGVFASGVVGYLSLNRLMKAEAKVDLNRFYGYAAKYKTLAFVFLVACMGLAGFPITPTFIGEDLIFSHIQQNQLLFAASISFSLIIDGISLMRIYARLFLGPYVHQTLEAPYRSS
jgi:NADH:ubiquinone oxidoreductase subunit 5 (subunit L)/multisubunit Na+/H+ antiporter MnhA subunit